MTLVKGTLSSSFDEWGASLTASWSRTIGAVEAEAEAEAEAALAM